MTLTLTTAALLLILAATAHAAKPKLSTLIAEKQVATWKCQDKLQWARTRASVPPWSLPRSTAYRQWVLKAWTQRHGICQAALREQARQWNWSAWLPDKWRRVGQCETGLNWLHANSSYVSAFGIQAGSHNGAYDSDAAKVGMPPWTDAQGRHPSPWQQYQTAVSHYNQFGGFSGWGCRNA